MPACLLIPSCPTVATTDNVAVTNNASQYRIRRASGLLTFVLPFRTTIPFRRTQTMKNQTPSLFRQPSDTTATHPIRFFTSSPPSQYQTNHITTTR
ncbi:hypothetical protein LY78DRAFT_655762 [Colletotrichum sublineola]|nr:hypothetical protein LY78DRAFT_655762 [Colletotrichum sublineola]